MGLCNAKSRRLIFAENPRKFNYIVVHKGVGMIKGRKVYDLLTNTYSTGWWIVDDNGNYYPVW